MLKIKQIHFPEVLNDFNFFEKIEVEEIIEVETYEDLPDTENVNVNAIYYITSTKQYYRWNATLTNWVQDPQGPIKDYLLKEKNVITEEQYNTLEATERDKFITVTTKDGIVTRTVTNGVIDKLIAPGNPNATPPIEAIYDYYSPNLIPYDFCYKLGINSLPGNKFILNDNLNNVIRIGSSGVFNMDFGNDPIFSIRILDNNNYTTYGTTLDIVYLTAQEEVEE